MCRKLDQLPLGEPLYLGTELCQIGTLIRLKYEIQEKVKYRKRKS